MYFQNAISWYLLAILAENRLQWPGIFIHLLFIGYVNEAFLEEKILCSSAFTFKPHELPSVP